jgi:hypothetical protein
LDLDPEVGVNELPPVSFVAWLVGCGFAYGFDGHKRDLVGQWLPKVQGTSHLSSYPWLVYDNP